MSQDTTTTTTTTTPITHSSSDRDLPHYDSSNSPQSTDDEASSPSPNDSPRVSRSSSPDSSSQVVGLGTVARKPLRVLISGAGLSGLACALNLRQYGIEATIIERDEGLTTREQGYNLTCKNIDHIWARCGLLETMKNYDCTSSLYFSYRNDGEILQQFEMPAVMLCPRDLLRSTMLKLVDTNNIQTGCHITEFHSNADNTVRVSLSDKTVRDYDVLIAADGIRSMIRSSLLPATPLNYTGVVIILGTAKCFHERARHRFQMLDGKVRMFCKPYGDTGAFWQCTYKVDTMQECYDMAKLGGQAIIDHLKHTLGLGGWASPTPEFLETTPASSIYVSPLIDRDAWEVSQLKMKNVVLIGDAAHPMTPFRGEGANNAMEDGVALADMIGQHDGSDYADVIDKFHETMMKRATKHVYDSRESVATTVDPRCVDKKWLDEHWDYAFKTAKHI